MREFLRPPPRSCNPPHQPQEDIFWPLQVQMQNPARAFSASDPIAEQLPAPYRPRTRFAGYVRIVNDGAVRLEVGRKRAAMSPDFFAGAIFFRRPTLRGAGLRVTGGQPVLPIRFFRPRDFALKIQADQLCPSLAVSELLNYNLG